MRIITVLLLILSSVISLSQNTRDIIFHSHNDYKNRIPLYDALSYGFRSIEVDIHLKNNKLYVAHDSNEIDTAKTLDKLYLNPLWDIFTKKNNEKRNPQTLYLLVDIKTDANETYHLLKEELSKYSQMFTSFTNTSKKEGFVTVIISGNRPIDLINKEPAKIVCVDGRPEDLKKDYSPFLIPLISESATEFAVYESNGSLSDRTYENVKQFVNDAHKQNRLTRLWGVPDSRKFWKYQFELGLDFVGTDNMEELIDFYQLWKKNENK